MVLDDVLVNFDEGRARQAVRVLGEFAKEGHQLLIFTCHEHVRQMFGEMKFDTRHIPLRDGVVAPAPIVQAEEPLPKPEPKPKPAPKPKKKKKPAPTVAAKPPEPPKPTPIDPPFELIESHLEYAFEGDIEYLPPRVVEPPKATPKPKRRRVKRRAAPTIESVLVAPPRADETIAPAEPQHEPHHTPVEVHVERPFLDEIIVEPIGVEDTNTREFVLDSEPPAVSAPPTADGDEWIRIGPQVRRRERVERYGELSSDDWVGHEFPTRGDAMTDQHESPARSLSKRVDAYIKERAGDRSGIDEQVDLADADEGDAAAA